MTALLSPLVAPDALASRLGHPSLRVFETTAHLTRPPGVSRYTLVSGREDYEPSTFRVPHSPTCRGSCPIRMPQSSGRS
jgi:hypothetical protein